MKQITVKAIIGGIRSKVDRGIGISLTTPELTPEEAALFFQMQGINVTLTILPDDEPQAPEYKVNKELAQKTPGQRLRSVLFIEWTQLGKPGDFEDFYSERLEFFINKVKAKLDGGERG